MADIQSFYEYIKAQVQTGAVQLQKEGEFGIPRILERFSLERISIEAPQLSSLELNEFRLQGIMRENGKSYDCTMITAAYAGSYDCLFQARLKQDEDISLNEIYPPAPAYVSLNFYSRPVNLFENMWLREAVIAADTKKETKVPLFSISLYYEPDCPLYENFRDFLPDAGEVILLTGDAKEPFTVKEPHYVVEGAFLKEISLPFYQEIKTAKECRLVINSHTTGDGWAENGETIYRSRVGVKFCISISGISEKGIWMSIDFGNFGNIYYLYANFEEGVRLEDSMDFIASMTGKSVLPDFPDWAPLENSPLTGMVIAIERHSGEGFLEDMGGEQNISDSLPKTLNGDRLMGCAFSFALDLPDVPIPFFEKEKGGAKAELAVQWNMLKIGGFLAVVAGFYGVWDNHHLKINVTLPDLEFQGIYEKKPGEKAANGIFPAFMDLTVRYIRLYGYIPENTYQLDFELENNNLHTIPIGEHIFQIDTVTGRAEYSPKGLQLAVMLEFTLLTAIIQLEGIYEKEDELQLLTLRGGLASPFYLSNLVTLITGEEVSKDSLDFVVSQLFVTYKTELSEENTSDNSLGRPVFFEFLCAIAFEWGDNNKISSSFHLEWEEAYHLWISAGITLFDCFDFAASCQVDIEGGTAYFREFRFVTKIRSIEITAIYDAQKNFIFRVLNFNLGEFIEGLISLIAPDHNWYLPWPFTILKQITLKELEVVIDRQQETIRARYIINLKILFLTVECIELFYDYGNGDFFVNVITNASIGQQENRQDVPGENGDNESRLRAEGGDIYGLNILKDIFPSIKDAGDRLFSLKYLGVGQHIQVDIPASFADTAFPGVLENMKKAIRKTGRPGLDGNNNWVAALQLKLLDAIDITLLMCDPVFYGLQVDIGNGSELVEQLAGLSVTILYSKVTETIGMFYARLKLPEAFRKIELGAVQLFLGEIAVWIYTNGNFKIDMGFPHNKDFSNSFGLTYLFFTGKGGFYFGLLNGDTSQAVPEVSKGHFEVVLELGIGISAGIGREISAGPLKAGAYLMLVAIFEGILANYVPAVEGQKDSVYYKVKACAGVTASIYGSVDFVLIQIGFSVNLSFMVDLVLERYQHTELSVRLSVSVNAYLKILFIKISFSFNFTWEDTFILGKKSLAPWEAGERLEEAYPLQEPLPFYEIQWYAGAVVEQKREICAEIVWYLTFDEPVPGKEASGKRKIAFLALLHGMTEETCFRLGYEDRLDTPFVQLAEICFRRALLSVRTGENQNTRIDKPLLEYLYEYLSRTDSFEEGFLFERLNEFLACNVILSYIKSSQMEENGENVEIQGIPFPLFPKMELIWFSAPKTTETYDLEQEPLVEESFFSHMQDYYHQLALWNEQPAKMRLWNGKNAKEGTSVSEFMFAQYFYMLTKTMVSLALEKIGEEILTLDQAVELITDKETMEKAAGMISRFSYGGSRAYIEGEGTKSMYDFAFQELDGLNPENFSDSDVIHRMSIRMKEAGGAASGIRSSLPRVPGIRLYERNLGTETMLRSLDEENSLEWSFTKRELVYPQGALRMIQLPKLMPFYRRQPKILELKNPQGLMEKKDESFWEIQSWIGGSFQIVSYKGDEKTGEYPFERGVLLRIPLKANKENIFEIQPLGYEVISKLMEILQDEVYEITPYRYTNELDSDNCGFASVDNNLFLYRNNLCLEVEKPELMTQRAGRRASFTEGRIYENSAYLTDKKQFLLLLKDAAMVNARGYYLKFHLEERQILQEGRMDLILWVQTKERADGIKIVQEGITKDSHPVVLTEEEISVYAYEPGTFAFYMEEEKDKSEIQEQYQMLGYQVLENESFLASNESRPVIAQETEEGTGYSQIVPAYCFAKGQGENPYGGIAGGSSLKMDFRMIDILGNKSALGQTWEIPYGYTDPLLPVTVYPHTKCTYDLEKTEEGYVFSVTFRYVEEAGQELFREEKASADETGRNENLRLAFWQLQCEDVQCFIELCGKEIQVEKTPLQQYVKALYEEKMPETVIYRLPFEGGEEIRELKAFFCLERKRELLSHILEGSREETEVLRVATAIGEDKEKINKNYLAVRGRDGQLFFVPPGEPAFTGYEIWTLQPLANRLLQLKDIPVLDEKGTEQTVSYYDVDMEVWADDFLMDLEGFLKPDSIYGEDRDTCEDLLAVKKELAEAIASGVVKISNGMKEEPFRNQAADYYKNLMLQNLYTGRGMDGVILLRSKMAAPSKTAWCFSAAADRDGLTLKPGSIKSGGILPVGIKAADVSKQMHINTNLQLTFTDWEIEGEEFYDFLTVQEQGISLQTIEGNLPYKRFPKLPVLKSQEYDHGYADEEVKEDDFCKWKYRVSFVHQTAEQDILTLRLLPENKSRLRDMDEQFLYAMVQYRYLRDRLLVDTELKDRLSECCRKICNSWSYGTWQMQAGICQEELKIRISLDFEKKRLLLLESNIAPDNLEISMKIRNGEYCALEKGEENFYILPDELAEPYEFLVSAADFDIRNLNRINARISVTRNQSIAEGDERFIYESEETTFPDELLPFLKQKRIMDLGSFERENFAGRLLSLCEGFGKAVMEVYCKAPVSLYGEEIIYSYLPVLYAPDIAPGYREEQIGRIYEQVKAWLEERFDKSVAADKGLIVQVHLTLFAPEDDNRNLAELTDLEFRV